MATVLSKPTTRQTRGVYRVLYASKSREIIVTLLPGDIMEFREKGCRARFALPIESAFKFAVRMTAMRAAAEKKIKKAKAKYGG